MQFPAPFEVDSAVTDQAAMITVSGELDIASAPELRLAFSRCAQQSLTSLTVDVGGVTFCDCSGLNVLLAARRWAASAGIRFRLANPGRQMLKLLEDTGTARLFREAQRPGSPPMTAVPPAGPERGGRRPSGRPSREDGYRPTGMSA